MNQGLSASRITLFLTLCLSVLAFSLVFSLSFQQDRAQVAEIGYLAWSHFFYAAELKDDMAVIDWSKNLEKLESVRAFLVEADSKNVARGRSLGPFSRSGFDPRHGERRGFQNSNPLSRPSGSFRLAPKRPAGLLFDFGEGECPSRAQKALILLTFLA